MRGHLRTILAAVCAVSLLPAVAAAQGAATISGRVLNEAGNPLPNASVFIPGGMGSLTKDDGRYSFTVPASRINGETVTITARLIGYKASVQNITLHAGEISQDFVLASNPVVLQGVVVTALGQEKEKSQLGTAQQQLSSAELNSTHDTNLINQLEGKVSGVTITSSGTQGGSTSFVIRGQNSIAGTNQPLFIVDGTAISSNDRGSTAGGGWDFGSVVSDLDPNNIATLTVLKGPNAAALYGARAANGVVVITTKKGANTDGKIQTRLTTSYTWDNMQNLPEYQNLYGQGSHGQFSYVDGDGGGVQDFNDQSYGPRFDGQPRPQFTGPDMPWVAHPDNVSSFFSTGHTLDVNLAASGGTENAGARLAVGVGNQNGVVPNNFFQKFTSALNGQLKLGNKFSANGSLQYIRNNALNRAGVGYNAGIMEQFIWFGRQVDMNALRANYDKMNQFGAHYNWNTSYHSNPFWLQYDNPERDTRDRLIGSVALDYKLTDWLTADVHAGQDYYSYNQEQDVAAQNVSWAGAGLGDLAYNGAFSIFNSHNTERNVGALVTANKQATSKLLLNANVGVNKRDAIYASNSQSTDGILVPGIYNVSNAAITPTLNQYNERRQINSAYGSASFTWDGWWTVEGTARNDWSSTLPKGANSYFYPSVNTSIVLTDAIPSLKSNFLSYAKVRGSIARVGADAGPYQLQSTYNGLANKFGSLPQYAISTSIANANLLPEITKSGEVGLELGFFGDRASLDASYYEKATSNQILSVTVSPASGFNALNANAGKISNKGFEAMLNVTPIRTASGFEWNTTFSYAHNKSDVISLAPGLTTIHLDGVGAGPGWGATVEARVGEPYGAIFGYTLRRDSATGLPLLSDGFPQKGPLAVLGSIQPDWTGGLSNEFKYRNLSLSFLVDFHEGGSILSISNMFGAYTGVFANTIRGREVDWNNPGIVAKGIDQATGQPNTTNVTTEDYNQSFFEIHEPWVYDDSWIKLREVRLGLDLPKSLLGGLHAQSASLSIYGRNLWLHTKVPNIDPEFQYTTSNYQGVEFAAIPNARTIGFNLQVTP
ncbi:MAG TPA: SusC/RagA family TonB-linked outer membrane protein [Gemmatimonadaceae bacterium]|nr:SusC/RagA family TonB-linked outer membrane protein [Gemmatimonadaceae bacterium]